MWARHAPGMKMNIINTDKVMILWVLTLSESGSMKDIVDSSPFSNTDTVFSSSPSAREQCETVITVNNSTVRYLNH
jgi:hypothetical protein